MGATIVGLYRVVTLTKMAVRPHGILSITLVKMVANHMIAFTLLEVINQDGSKPHAYLLKDEPTFF